jgi:hypothetical protein
MSDFDREYLLLDAVHEFRAEALPYVHPAGTAAVRATVRRRRQARIAALAALIVVLVLAPVAAFAAIGGGDQSHPAVSPPASGTASPSAPPSPGAVQSHATPSTPPPPQPPASLAGATFTLGEWRPVQGGPNVCPTGTVTFKNSVAQVANKAPVYLRQTALVDVDQDGANEVAVVLWCLNGQAGTYQALALKAAPDGTLTTLGEIWRSGLNGENLLTVTPADNGRVDLTLGDIVPCCATPDGVVLTQIRTFAWNGAAFTQVAGPTTFLADRSAVDLAVSAPSVHFVAASGGKLSGTLTVTIHNKGPGEARQVSLLVWLDDTMQAGAGGDWGKCARVGTSGVTSVCQLGDVAAGATVALTLPLVTDMTQGITLQPRVGDTKYDDLHILTN